MYRTGRRNIMLIDTKKKLVAGLSITSNVILTVLKIVVGVISGSISIVSEAIHSASDLFASVLTLFSVIKSSRPADDEHPYGHGKYEDMAGFIEGLLIVLASLFIIWESAKKIILNTNMEPENHLGIAVMLVAVVMNIIVSYLLFKVAKESNSVSLYADGEHLRTDVYSSLGVLFGLILIKITGHSALDSVIAILIAVVIFKAGYVIIRRTMNNLLDRSLPECDIAKIKQIIEAHSDIVKLKEHGIKARQVGPTKDIDLIVQFPRETTIYECHKICDDLEHHFKTLYKGCTISIHAEPL